MTKDGLISGSFPLLLKSPTKGAKSRPWVSSLKVDGPQGFDLALFLEIKPSLVKFIYSEKATKFCEISTNYSTGNT